VSDVRQIETSIDIPASTDRVWATLTDFERHAEWNPFMRSIEGRAVVGERLRVEFTPPGQRTMTMHPVVTACEPGRRLEWLGSLGVRHLFDGRHAFELTRVDATTTHLVHRESFTGILVPLLWRWLRRPTTEGFEQFNQALADRCSSVTVDE
jgi:hypothetical protein